MSWQLQCWCSLFTAFILALSYFISNLFSSLLHQRLLSHSLSLFSCIASFFLPLSHLPNPPALSSLNWLRAESLHAFAWLSLTPLLAAVREGAHGDVRPGAVLPSPLISPISRITQTNSYPFLSLHGFAFCFLLPFAAGWLLSDKTRHNIELISSQRSGTNAHGARSIEHQLLAVCHKRKGLQVPEHQ